MTLQLFNFSTQSLITAFPQHVGLCAIGNVGMAAKQCSIAVPGFSACSDFKVKKVTTLVKATVILRFIPIS